MADKDFANAELVADEVRKIGGKETAHAVAIDIRDRGEVRSVVQELKPNQIYHLAAVSAVGASWPSTCAAASASRCRSDVASA